MIPRPWIQMETRADFAETWADETSVVSICFSVVSSAHVHRGSLQKMMTMTWCSSSACLYAFQFEPPEAKDRFQGGDNGDACSKNHTSLATPGHVNHAYLSAFPFGRNEKKVEKSAAVGMVNTWYHMMHVSRISLTMFDLLHRICQSLPATLRLFLRMSCHTSPSSSIPCWPGRAKDFSMATTGRPQETCRWGAVAALGVKPKPP